MEPITADDVHKTSRAEALVETITAGDKNTWLLSAVIPRGHRENGARPHRMPTILGVEVVRQAGMAVCTKGHGLPADTAFTIQELVFEWLDDRPEFPRFDALRLDVTVTTRDHASRKGALASLRLDYEFHHDGVLVATAMATAKCLSPEHYALFRRGAPVAGRAPARYDETAWTLRDMWPDGVAEGVLGWDEADPFVFDHAVDHVPGMQFVRAAISLYTKAGFGVEPKRLDIGFHQFAELTDPVFITAKFGNRRLDVSFLQGDDTVVTAEAD